MDEASLYEEVSELYRHSHTTEGARGLLLLVTAQWSAMRRRPVNPHDAEVCRLVMLAAVQAGDHDAGRLWRVRAASRFALLGWNEGLGALLMGEAFVSLARANDDYRGGRTLDVLKASPVALAILDEIELISSGEPSGFTLGPGSPTHAVLRRFVHEKRGFMLLVAGDPAAARRSYDLALSEARGSSRGEVKVMLGRLLVEYTRASDDSARTGVAFETENWGRRARDVGELDLAATAELNLEVMRLGGPGLHAYEIL